MNRFKFRVWDNKKRIFVPQGEIIFSDYGDTNISVSPNCIEYIGDSCHDYEETGRFIITQYTTQKDINNVEIYEGDICKCWGGVSFVGKWEYYGIYEVRWQGNGFDMCIEDCGYNWGVSPCFEYIEVIGNRFEKEER